MPFALLTIGALLIISALRGTYSSLGKQLVADMVGSGSGTGFIAWVAAIGAVGAIGYAPDLRTPSRILLGLIFLGILISNQGVFAQLKSIALNPPQPTAAGAGAVQDPALTGSIPVTLTGSSGSGSSTNPLSAIPVIGGLLGGGSSGSSDPAADAADVDQQFSAGAGAASSAVSAISSIGTLAALF